MHATTTGIRAVIDTIGRARGLDAVAEKVTGWVHAATRSTPVKNALSGSWLGHQLHPVLTDLPIGAWGAATALDLTGADESAARRLVGLGILASAPTALSGASDWSDTVGADRRVGLIHGLSNAAASTLQVLSWVARRRGHRGAGAVLSILGLGTTLASAYLGGHLSFTRGVGVNHTAFQRSRRRWIDVGAEADVAEGDLVRIMADDVPVLLARQDGEIHAIAAVCSHAGGPLEKGTLDADGCVTCPWHGSRFRVHDGTVERGPASVPQPQWDVRIDEGRILIHPA